MGGKPTAKTAAALIVGNELLSGKVQDENVIALARTLSEMGVRLRRVVMVADDVDVIAAEVSALARSHSVVFTSGGVGPTHDDVTVEGVARAFGASVVSSPHMESMLRAHYGERCTEGHLRMALVPEGAELVSNAEVKWPTIVMRNVWLLPGIPEVFLMKLALIRERIEGGAPWLSRAVFTKMEEGDLKPLLDRVVAMHVDVEVGSYPKWSDPTYRTKLTFDGHDRAAIERALAFFLSLLPDSEPQSVD
ncbi:MAG TPA: molybdopterin-binding protein [Polyangiaceae bacterium]|nr:molybdopterin-binding protein [Polyangiaceae bacterium]